MKSGCRGAWDKAKESNKKYKNIVFLWFLCPIPTQPPEDMQALAWERPKSFMRVQEPPNNQNIFAIYFYSLGFLAHKARIKCIKNVILFGFMEESDGKEPHKYSIFFYF